MEEILEFCFKEFAAVCLFWNFFVLWYSCNITYHFKEIFAYCDNFLYFAHRCAKHCTKILKLSFAVRTLPIACSKLGKTQIIKDAGRGMVRNTGFCDQNAAAGCILELRIF